MIAWILGSLLFYIGWSLMKALIPLWRTRNIPGPSAGFSLFGNYFDLVGGGWGQRELTLKRLHREYGPVLCLWQPFPCPPLIVTSHDIVEADEFDSVREERSMAPDSIMSMKDSSEYRAKNNALQFLKEGDSWIRFEVVVNKWVEKLPKFLLSGYSAEQFEKSESISLEQKVLNVWALRLVIEWLLGVEISKEEAEDFDEEFDHFVEEVTKRTHQPQWMWYLDYVRWEKYRMNLKVMTLRVKGWCKASPVLQGLPEARRLLFSADEVLMAVVAGYSTTAIALRSCCAALASIKDRELNVTEVLSKEPTVPFSSKIVERDIHCGGYIIPWGTRLMRLKTLIKGSRPFGGGNRRCFGQRFAMHILRKATEKIVLHFQLCPEKPSMVALVSSPSPQHESMRRHVSDHGVHLTSTSPVSLAARKKPK